MKLKDSSPVPLYKQIVEDIKSNIVLGNYHKGEKIPSEFELSSMFSVSRVTVRRAIEELVKEGYLESRQGKGTFVTYQQAPNKIRQRKGPLAFSMAHAEDDAKSSTQVVGRSMVSIPPEERPFFGSSGDSAVLILCVRSVEDTPILAEQVMLPYEGFSFLLKEQLDGTTPTELMRDYAGLEPSTFSNHTIEVVTANTAMASSLDVSPGEPLFLERAYILDQNGNPLCASKRFFVGSRNAFEL